MAIQIRTQQIVDDAVTAAKIAVLDAKIEYTTTHILASATDIVHKGYVDSLLEGLTVKAACQLATAAALPACTYSGTPNFTLTADADGALEVDGQPVFANYRVWVKNQANEKQNGIYVVTDAGSASDPWVLTRASDMNTSAEFLGAYAWVLDGTANTDTAWVATVPSSFTLDTNDVTVSQFSGAGTYTAGNGIEITGSSIAVKAETDAGIAVGLNGVSVKLESQNPGLEIAGTGGGKGLSVKAYNGLELGASGVAVKLQGTAPGLEFDAGALKAKVKANCGIALDGDGLQIALAGSKPGLQFTGGALQVQLLDGGGLKDGGSGIKLNAEIETDDSWDGNATEWTLHSLAGGLLIVTLNGIVCQMNGTGANTYTISGNPTKITFNEAPASGSITQAYYVY